MVRLFLPSCEIFGYDSGFYQLSAFISISPCDMEDDGNVGNGACAALPRSL